MTQEIVHQAHGYGWWLKHCDSHLGSAAGKPMDHFPASRKKRERRLPVAIGAPA